MPQNLIYDLSIEQLNQWLQSNNQPAFRSTQIWKGLYKHAFESFDAFTNLPKTLRELLKQEFSFNALTPVDSRVSKDGLTEKILFALHDDVKIESVLMRYEERNTICVSTQAGCAMDCAFCATGKMGFQRNLSKGEISAQVLYFERILRSTEQTTTNVVLMGMGEPFNNYENSISAIYDLNDETGLMLGIRRFTISTVGIIPRIRQFADENHQINLAISLHAATDELRSELIPINRFYPLEDLMNACRYYLGKTHRRITFEYALINDVNDSPEQAHSLAVLLKGLLCHVNLIGLNPIANASFNTPDKERIEAFQSILEKMQIPTTIRLRRGVEIQAGCGQLAYTNLKMI